MKDFIKKALIRTTAYYTVFAVLFSIVIMLVYAGNEDGQNLSALRTFLLFPFSLCFGIANTLLYRKTPGPAGRWTIHCALTVLSAYLCLILPATADDRGSEKLIGFLTVLAVYIICAVVLVFMTKRFRRLMDEERQLTKKK